jgi:hypothetical protein
MLRPHVDVISMLIHVPEAHIDPHGFRDCAADISQNMTGTM